MKFMKRTLVCAAAMAGAALAAMPVSASPLILDYSATPAGGGLYHYTFTLKLDNHDSSWAAGQQWDWITFGDVAPGPSPLADFTNFFTSAPAVLEFSSGGHNGPTIAYGANSVGLPGWQPAAVGSTLTWSGDSHSLLGAGQLKFSTLVLGNGAAGANFEVANSVTAGVPEPTTWAMMLVGFGAIGCALRRRPKVAARIRFA